VDPSVDLTVLEAEETLGGTWCAARIFPGLLANHAIGAYEYADKPMADEGMAQYGYIPADQIHAYLTEYAREWGVYDRIRFRTSVERVCRHEDGRRWVVRLQSQPPTNEPQASSSLVFDKVILATGLSSTPQMPTVDSSSFGARVLHSKDTGANTALFASASVESVTVYGGGKSALDAVALALRSHKKRVNWVVRASGAGPGAFVPPVVFGNKIPYDVVATRLASKLHPSIYTARVREWWWRFLHSGENRVGSWLLWAYHGLSSRKVLSWARYEENENLAQMKPLIMDRG
jgi:dimethylaniline monooxygenase (N-oxide forming)